MPLAGLCQSKQTVRDCDQLAVYRYTFVTQLGECVLELCKEHAQRLAGHGAVADRITKREASFTRIYPKRAEGTTDVPYSVVQELRADRQAAERRADGGRPSIDPFLRSVRREGRQRSH